MSRARRARFIAGATLLLLASPGLAGAAPLITKTYSYFSIGGRTAEDLDSELERRGPMTRASGFRHPGATQISFGGEVTYLEKPDSCAIGGTKVTLKTKIILPRWTNRRTATGSLRLIWDTLSSDIKRHEERHAEIARTYARQLEQSLEQLRPQRSCTLLETNVGATTRRIVDQHDKEQLRFDMVESKNFDARMMRLLKYRASAMD